jgi:hypothetical protein
MSMYVLMDPEFVVTSKTVLLRPRAQTRLALTVKNGI